MHKLSAKEIWKDAWSSPYIRRRLILISVLTPIFFWALPHFFNYIETRNGVRLNDWLLAQIPPHNVSGAIFVLIWGMIGLTLYRSVRSPSIFITYCFTLAMVTVARVLCIFLVPLSPPAGLIPLSDPLTGIFYGGAPITKDLFFSGHIAMLSVIYFSLKRKTDKLIGLLAVIALAILLAVQHIHYTIDILTAPVVVYMLYLVTRAFIFKDENGHEEKV
jgi:hypothetical protein